MHKIRECFTKFKVSEYSHNCQYCSENFDHNSTKTKELLIQNSHI